MVSGPGRLMVGIVIVSIQVFSAFGADWRAVVDEAVATQQPPWIPTEKTLRGWVIGIDASGGGARDRAQQEADDFVLLTAEYLYHAVVRSGGRAILTRVGDFRYGDEVPDAEQRVEILQRADVDLCLRLVPVSGSRPQVAAVREGDAGQLADALAKQLNASQSDLAGFGGPFIEQFQQAKPGAPLAVVAAATPGDRRTRPHAVATLTEQILAGLIGYVGTHAKSNPRIEEDAGGASTPATPDPPVSRRIQRAARAVWPAGELPAAQLDWFCDRFGDNSISNSSLTHFSVGAEWDGERVKLTGTTNEPRIVDSLVGALQVVGYENVADAVRRLPDHERLGDKLFGVCHVPMALTFNRPSARRGLQTQLLYGEPVFLLDQTEDEYLLHGSDGYWGWVPRNVITPKTAEEFAPYNELPRAAAIEEIRRDGLRIPAGAKLPIVAQDAAQWTLLLPGGQTAAVEARALRALHSEQAVQDRVLGVLDMLNTPYVFGGRSPLGLDCSGLVMNVLARSGEFYARDAWQQAFAGRLVATQWHRTDLQAGDLIFFIHPTGRIYHTGVMISDRHIVHSTPPVVRINSLFPDDRLYDPRLDRDFFIGKRP